MAEEERRASHTGCSVGVEESPDLGTEPEMEFQAAAQDLLKIE